MHSVRFQKRFQKQSSKTLAEYAKEIAPEETEEQRKAREAIFMEHEEKTKLANDTHNQALKVEKLAGKELNKIHDMTNKWQDAQKNFNKSVETA